ncbi:hypothetical protein D3C77_320240 [compost metagenome]
MRLRHLDGFWPEIIALGMVFGLTIRDRSLDKAQSHGKVVNFKDKSSFLFLIGISVHSFFGVAGNAPILYKQFLHQIKIAFWRAQEDEPVKTTGCLVFGRFKISLLLFVLLPLLQFLPGLQLCSPLHPVVADHLYHSDGFLLCRCRIIICHFTEYMSAMLGIGWIFISTADTKKPFSE